MAKDLTKLLEERFDLIENSPNDVVEAAEREEKRLLKELIKEVGKLDLKDGQIVLNQKNLDLVDDITKKLKTSFYDSDYIGAVDGMIKDLDIVKDLTKDYMSGVFGKFDSKKPDLLFGTKKAGTLDALIGKAAMDVTLFNPIQSILIDGITHNASFSEVYDNLLKVTTGDEKTDGKLKAYARTIANTTMSVSASSYIQSISQTLGIVWYRYIGGKVPDTRCFCEERNNGYFHIEEIWSWGRMENLGECNTGGGWAGMISGTNESNILSNKGGWNCKHDFIPISLGAVPMTVVNNAIKKGWFEPTEEEKFLLGLE